jgi:hypothetical protein
MEQIIIYASTLTFSVLLAVIAFAYKYVLAQKRSIVKEVIDNRFVVYKIRTQTYQFEDFDIQQQLPKFHLDTPLRNNDLAVCGVSMTNLHVKEKVFETKERITTYEMEY